MDWLKSTFGTNKPIIAMVHIRALPGDPQYDPQKGMSWLVDTARKDVLALQAGGVDALMFSNEFSLPYLTKVEPITPISMARIIAELFPEIKIPFGVNVLWDPEASIDLAAATGAKFVREIFSGVYASDFGIWNTNSGSVVRHQHAVHAQNVKLLYNIVPESASYLAERDIASIARSTVFNCRPDGLCVSGLTAGSETSTQVLKIVKDAVPDTPVFANTGVRPDNVQSQLAFADGAVVGTTFKRDGKTWNEVDADRVKTFMDAVRAFRK